MNGDLISRQAAIALADTLKDDVPDDERIADAVIAHNEGILEYQTKLSLLPSAQPKVIRCENCEWWTKQDKSIQGRCELMQMYPTGEWFCGNAQERVSKDE